jgi:hypothetical protein
VLGSLSVPAIPMNTILEKAVLPNEDKVANIIASLVNF